MGVRMREDPVEAALIPEKENRKTEFQPILSLVSPANLKRTFRKYWNVF